MNMEQLLPAFVFLVAFLLGSVPVGLIVARAMAGQDIRSQGSGNIGTTNVSRALGFWPAGAVTLLLDVLKAVIPILLVLPSGAALWVHGFGVDGYPFTQEVVWTTALMAVAGHCFSPWLGFNGGKGVAAALGAFLVLSPWAALVGVISFALVFLLSRVVSLSSISGLILAAIGQLILFPSGAHLWAGLGIVLVILFRHEGNLDALLENRERSF